jgi:hypothetical protein
MTNRVPPEKTVELFKNKPLEDLSEVTCRSPRFGTAVASKAMKSMRQTLRKRKVRNRIDLELQDITWIFNPVLRGWMED